MTSVIMTYHEHDLLVSLQVACMQFINIIVHSVEDVNFRVHLQHEFSLLGLDDYLVVRTFYNQFIQR